MTTSTPVWMGPKRGGGHKERTGLQTALPRAGVVEVETPALIVLPVRGPSPSDATLVKIKV